MHFKSLAFPLLDERREAGADALVVDRVKEIISRLSDPRDSKSFYIACFSASGDQLSQWRGYASDTSLVSVGFSTSALRERLSAYLPSGARLLQVLYEDHDQRALFNSALPVNTVSRALIGSAGAGTRSRLYFAAITCKHRGFREEQEWRIAVPIEGGLSYRAPDLLKGSGRGRSTFLPTSRFRSRVGKTIDRHRHTCSSRQSRLYGRSGRGVGDSLPPVRKCVR